MAGHRNKVTADVSHLALEEPGFDDAEISTQVSPALTTMRVPTEEMGHLTADHLLAKVNGRPTPHSVELDVELIIRESAGAPPRP